MSFSAGADLAAFSTKGTLAGLFIEAGDYPNTQGTAELALDLGGIPGTRHHGHARKAGPREPWYPRGMEMRHGRQLSAVAPDELAEIAAKLCIGRIEPQWLGANLLVSGVPEFSWLPAGTRLHFAQASLFVEAQNAPCSIVGREVAARTGADVARRFSRAATGLRGLVLSVERAGTIRAGETIELRLPAQKLWKGHADTAA